MPSKTVLESDDLDIGEIELLHVNKVGENYLCFLKGISYYNDYDFHFFNKNKCLNIKRVGGYEYLASLFVIDQAKFIDKNNNVIIMASSDSWVNCNYVNLYSQMVSSWNSYDSVYLDWADLSSRKKKVWLDLSADWSDLKKKNIENDIVVDCSRITDIPSLYCCLGESILGKKGYVGRNLDSLEDCLIDIKHQGKKIIFKNSNRIFTIFNTALNRKKYQDDYVSIMANIFKKYGFKVEFM
ncbi:barstar family protein [Xenorhabdus szentirmaii]|uniref:Barstar (barnase inhibitor) domain-containing protein n=1 Tax=Xenorhabdus szentirmaii DSM 16338 TaxID=1427518 RepID=W1J8G9_9GAMM|nr:MULTISPECIES: barstar family protein [Xenorhabdus]MBD2782905.1 barstar family protein [Xenorhabdus sp. 38]MBD2806559.1 barstar family protein [Xenorhabdus sp. ZM]PHM31364.1 hypothetical protein Xsze_02057 [Xenorhabdus szentirmaii DSM 16338]PHM42252.1 hypothetical protein Xszus_01984 [Xenorhabdus szentirmaii]CDL85795.1 conserved hypothetical protein [Xenorhabdus szentirmaii DSM 16338]